MNTILSENKSLILDATNTKFSEWSNMTRNLPICKKIAWIFEVDPKVAYDRIRNDINSNKDRANVPLEIIYQYYNQLDHSLKYYAEYFDEVIKIN